MKKTILVVGGNSVVAKDFVAKLKDTHSIITAGKENCDVVCDVTKGINIPRGVEVVINFAAAFGGSSEQDIVNATKTNTEGVLNVCVAAQQAGIKHMINISSVYTLLDPSSAYYSIYALSKKQGDELASYFCKLNNIPLTIIKPSQIYGDSYDYAKHQPFFYLIISNASKGQDVTIYGGHDALRNYIHSADIAEIITKVVDRQIEGEFICCFPKDISYSEIAQVAQQLFKKGGRVIFDKSQPDIEDNTFPIDSVLYDMINYTPTISLEKGIGRIKQYSEDLKR